MLVMQGLGKVSLIMDPGAMQETAGDGRDQSYRAGSKAHYMMAHRAMWKSCL